MKAGRIAALLTAACAAGLLAAVPATATAAGSPSFSPTPDVLSEGPNYQVSEVYYTDDYFIYLGEPINEFVLSNQYGPWTTINVASGSGNWQEYVDASTGKCLYDAGEAQYLYPLTCNSSKPSDLWASATVGNPNDWAMWNEYMKEKYPDYCGNTNAPVITGLVADGPLQLDCPLSTGYTNQQLWVWNQNVPGQ